MKNKLWYQSPAKCFEEALPIGNGKLGGMVYCDPVCDKISLNHSTLSTGTPTPSPDKSYHTFFRKAQDLILDGKVHEAEAVLKDNFLHEGTRTYQPMGNLFVKCLNADSISEYKRVLDMENGIVFSEYTNGNTRCGREYFSTNPDDCIVAKYIDDAETEYEIFFDSPLKFECHLNKMKIIVNGECASDVLHKGNGKFEWVYSGEGVKFTTVIAVKTDGNISGIGNKLFVKNSKCMEIYISTETSFVSYKAAPEKETRNSCENKSNELILHDFDSLKEKHIMDFSQLYKRTDISFNAGGNEIPTDCLITEGRQYGLMAEKIFSFAKYLMISASRKESLAMNLQGIWNEDMDPAFCANLTLNINTQMNYWAMQALNLPEISQPLDELLYGLADTGRETAKSFYNAPGFTAHVVTDLWRKTSPPGCYVATACWNMSAAWILCQMWDKYQYTDDIEYAKKIYPYIKESVIFYKSILVEYNGKMILAPSSSPENVYLINNKECGIAKYTTMTQTILIDLFTAFIDCNKLVGSDEELIKEIVYILPKLDTFEIGTHGQLLEWDEEYEEKDIHHRHVSHLYGIFPSDLFFKDEYKNFYNAAKKSLEIRGIDGTGWSIAWKMNLWARFKDGNLSFECFRRLMKPAMYNLKPKCSADVSYNGGIYPNMFDAHPPFQIDGNFGACMAIIQWILQCVNNVIYILPALPDELKDGYIKGISAKGNIKLNIWWQDGVCVKCTAISPENQKAVFNVQGKEYEVELTSNNLTYVI